MILFNIDEMLISLSFIFLPLVLSFLHCKILCTKNKAIVFLNYYLFISVGIQGTLTGIFQIFFPQTVVDYTQWPASPFITELGMANLSYGILAIVSMWMSRGWKNATAIGYALLLFFTGLGHVVDIFKNGVSPGNAGGFLFSDCLVPVPLIVLSLFQPKRAPLELRLQSNRHAKLSIIE